MLGDHPTVLKSRLKHNRYCEVCQLFKTNGHRHRKQSGHAIRALTPDQKRRLIDEYYAEARAAMAVGAELSEQGAAETSVEPAGADAVASAVGAELSKQGATETSVEPGDHPTVLKMRLHKSRYCEVCQLVKINGYKHTKQSGHAIRALTPDEKLRLVDEYYAENAGSLSQMSSDHPTVLKSRLRNSRYCELCQKVTLNGRLHAKTSGHSVRALTPDEEQRVVDEYYGEQAACRLDFGDHRKKTVHEANEKDSEDDLPLLMLCTSVHRQQLMKAAIEAGWCRCGGAETSVKPAGADAAASAVGAELSEQNAAKTSVEPAGADAVALVASRCSLLQMSGNRLPLLQQRNAKAKAKAKGQGKAKAKAKGLAKAKAKPGRRQYRLWYSRYCEVCQLVKKHGHDHAKRTGHAIRALTPDEKLRLVDEYDAGARAAMAVGAELSEQGAANTSVEQAGADAVASVVGTKAAVAARVRIVGETSMAKVHSVSRKGTQGAADDDRSLHKPVRKRPAAALLSDPECPDDAPLIPPLDLTAVHTDPQGCVCHPTHLELDSI